MLRIVLFMLTNIAILAVVSVVLMLLGVNPQTMAGSLIFCAVVGFSGSLISLFLSKKLAKRSTRTQLITEPSNPTEQWLFDTVKRLSDRAGIDMPEVGIFPNPQPNAFATGWHKDKALVAVSSGILQAMNKDELEAVIGHEIGHVANGDMVTLAMIQGVVNTFVMFFARLVGQIVDQAVFKNERGTGPGYFMVVTVLQVVFGFLATAIVSWFSRYREYRADEAGARLSGKHNMISALQALKPASQQPDHMPEQMKAFSISEGKSRGFKIKNLFASHPPLDDRIAALENFSG